MTRRQGISKVRMRVNSRVKKAHNFYSFGCFRFHLNSRLETGAVCLCGRLVGLNRAQLRSGNHFLSTDDQTSGNANMRIAVMLVHAVSNPPDGVIA